MSEPDTFILAPVRAIRAAVRDGIEANARRLDRRIDTPMRLMHG
ncbi:hypothetical protein [Ancylobacter pratisalsi]|nr:hypothetical protein [Ancylobacter pratisalsi]